jgi:multidrug resistance protein, MATE family
MRFRPQYRRIWGLAYPLIVLGIGETVVEVTDTVFLAHYGLIELAAIGLAAAIYSLAMFAPLGLVDGIQVVIGRRAGQGRDADIGRVFNQGLYLLTLAAVALILVIKFPLPLLTREVFASAEVHANVDAYLQIVAFGLLFNGVNLAYSAFYLGIGRTRVLIGATVLLVVTNIVLDWLLIFGHLGLPELGIEGAAIASLAAEIVVFLFLTADVLRNRYLRRYNLLRFGRWDGPLARRLLRISTPVSLEALVETTRWLLFFLIIEQMGETQLATANIVYACLAVFLIPVEALGEAACTATSNLLGQSRSRAIRLLLRRTILLGYAAVLPMLALALLFPEWVLFLFTPDAELVAAATGPLLVVILAALIAVPAEIHYAAVVGTGDTPAVFAIQTLISVTVLVTAWYAGLVLGLPLAYVWMAEAIGWGVCLGAAWAWIRAGYWRRLDV